MRRVTIFARRLSFLTRCQPSRHASSPLVGCQTAGETLNALRKLSVTSEKAPTVDSSLHGRYEPALPQKRRRAGRTCDKTTPPGGRCCRGAGLAAGRKPVKVIYVVHRDDPI